ncbi:DUF429 domain-containing protein [Nocardioides sp. Soil796]|uniref:DUF429 domain-containing protein n=1 Tax=Nocardioides sp. Soil796 TaxID=1736412 RepID=UPI000710297F|nr:DUF429 domain-containing protein [Nocardioides sp. Soil796]KRF11012.1 hypothetical protein ASH02_19440 [Nocardioides sp. Soil796]
MEVGQHFVGIDLAWKPANRTGIAVVDESGRLRTSGVVRSDDEIADWLAMHAAKPVVVAVDAPLVVPNATGQRVGENLVARAFASYHASPYPSNRANPMFDPPRAESLAHRFGWSVDPDERGSAESPVCIEVYPHPAMVSLFGLSKVLPYKSGRGRTSDARRETFGELMDHLEAVHELQLSSVRRWQEIRTAVDQATRHVHLEVIEDEIDAILCAHLAWLWHHRPGELRVYGSLAEGYIVAPPPPERDGSPATHDHRLVATFGRTVIGRPAGYGGEERERAWKQAVRTAFRGCALPKDCRVAIELAFMLAPHQTGLNEPDLDNLVTPTIDALDEVLGRLPGTGSRIAADDVRVDRIMASKQPATGEPGAHIVVRELPPR